MASRYDPGGVWGRAGAAHSGCTGRSRPERRRLSPRRSNGNARVSASERDESPLVEVEQAVQARAKDLVLDPSSPEGRARLRSLVEDEVTRWRADHRRGIRPFDLADPEVVVDRAFRNLAGYGPLDPL